MHEIVAQTHSEHASFEGEIKSIRGNIFMIAGDAILWCAARQRIVALSSTEAEYIAMAIQEALWLRPLIMDH